MLCSASALLENQEAWSVDSLADLNRAVILLSHCGRRGGGRREEGGGGRRQGCAKKKERERCQFKNVITRDCFQNPVHVISFPAYTEVDDTAGWYPGNHRKDQHKPNNVLPHKLSCGVQRI